MQNRRNKSSLAAAPSPDEAPAAQNLALFNPPGNQEALDSLEGIFDELEGDRDREPKGSEPKSEESETSADPFDEVGYLRLHPDVQQAIERGEVESGYKHYVLCGEAEGRALPKPGPDSRRERYFDEEFYRRRYHVAANAFEHYCSHGWKIGYMPNPFFSPVHYGKHHGIHEEEPLLHFLANWQTCSFVSPAFDIGGYLKHNPDVANAHIEPFLHFLLGGMREGRTPGFPLFELPDRNKSFAEFDWEYAGENLGVPLACIDAPLAQAYVDLVDERYYQSLYGQELMGCSGAEHYAMEGWRRGLSPNPFFDSRWYLAHHCVSGLDPIWHHLLKSTRPTPFFCAKSYLRANTDVAEIHTERTAFSHFVMSGAMERRSLGLAPEYISAARKVEPEYDWKCAADHYDFPSGLESRAHRSAALGAGRYAPRTTADSFQMSLALRKSQGKKVVSFDIWDTVLRRACDPDEIKFYAACFLLRSLQRSGASKGLTAFEVFHLRQLAEFRIADEHYEFGYSEMIREWLSLCGVRLLPQVELLAQQVAESEIAREIAVSRVDPTMLAILEALPESRKIAISDFYLPSGTLRRILAHHDVDKHFDAIYVSCDFMKTKRAGALFDEVLLCEKLSAGELLHLGDNQKSDYEVPLKRGIDAFHFSDIFEEKGKEHRRAYLDALLTDDSEMITECALREMFGDAMGSSERASRPRQAPLPVERVAVDKQISSRVGSVDFLSLIFAGFGVFVLEKALAAKTEKIFFATREGEFFRRVYDLLAVKDVLGAGSYPSSAIVEVSRRATFSASLRSISIQEMMRLWSVYSVQSMSAFGTSLNLDPDRLAGFCERYGLTLAEPLAYPWRDDRVILLFEDAEFQGWFSSESMDQRERLWSYLERIGFEPAENKTRLIVDIGWRGSIQDNLAFLVNGRLEGVYLALYKYLAEQPLNVGKSGFLADHNGGDDGFHIGDFAPLEFISNSCGGSVIGYNNGIAIRDVYPTEERLIRTEIRPIQEAILAKIDALAPVLCRSPLTWADRWGLVARRAVKCYMEKPDLEIARVFQRLEHNETFGAGEIQVIAEVGDLQLGHMAGAELHSFMTEKLRTHRWPQAWLRFLEGTGFFNELLLDQKLMLPRLDGVARAPAAVRSLGYKVSIFAPEPLRGSGGHRTIYNLARALDASGFRVHLFSERRGDDYAYKEEELSGSGVRLYDRWFSGIVPDAAFATIQYSSSYLTKFFDQTVNKFYFVQDFEAEFNPVSDGYVRGQNSYTEGHNHICIGRWLTHRLRAEYGCGAAGAGLGVDTTVYRPLKDTARLNRIAVLFQPEKWRRLPEHCLEALEKVKARRPQTEIVFYGSRSSPNAAFRYINLGLINDLSELNRLYNSALVGLCISLTNPSRIPYEMMAAGCVPIDVYRYNNLFDYDNGTGLLAYQSAESIAEAILHLLDQEDELAVRRAKCIATVAHRTMEWETDSAVNATEHVLGGGELDEIPQPLPSYTDQPFISVRDDRPAVRAWCSWQRKLSDMKRD